VKNKYLWNFKLNFEFLVAANVVPSLSILVTLMIEAILSS
jgi:hypothetical protein